MFWFSDKRRHLGDEEAAQREEFIQRLRQVLECRSEAPDLVLAVSKTAPPTATATYEGRQLRNS